MWEFVSGKKEKGRKKENSKPFCPPPGSPLAAARRTHSYLCDTLLPGLYPKAGLCRVPRMENPHGRIHHSKGPSD